MDNLSAGMGVVSHANAVVKTATRRKRNRVMQLGRLNMAAIRLIIAETLQASKPNLIF